MGICSSSSGAEPGTNAPSQDPSPHQEPAPKTHDSSQATKKRSSASPPEPSSKPAAVSPGLGLHSSAVAQRSPVGSPHHQQQAGEQHDRHQHDDEQQDDDDDEQQLQDDDHDHDDDVSVSVSASVSASASAAEDDAEAEAAEDGDEVDDGTGYEPYASFRRQSTTLNAFLLTPSIELLHEYDRTVPPREPSAQHGPGDAEDRHARGPSMGGYDAALGNFSAEELYSDYGGYGDYTYDEGDDVEVLHTAKAKVKAKGDGDADSNNGDEDDGEHRYDGIESVEALVNSNGDPVSLEELAVSTGSSEFQLGSVTGKAAVVWEHSHIIQPLSQLAGLDARYRTAHIKSREQLEAAARGRDWNDEFQRLHERVENTPYGAQERQRALELLRADFVDFCTPVVQVLVEEVELGVPVEERVVQPDKSTAGTAGGEKFKVGGVLFKFARDWKGIYGSEALAQKAATLDVTGLNAITACNLPLLHTSLTAVFRVRGYCISAIALAPIGDAKSLVYGSEDAGRRIRDSSPAMRVLMGQVATVLNLKAHRVRDKKKREFTLHMAVDVEGHRSPVDGRFYLVDAGRLCPPMPPRPGRHRDFLTALFRPEFLRRHCAGRPLSADAFSRFGHLDHDEHHSDILAAYKLLATEVFPALAKTLVEAMQHPDEGKDDGNKSDSELSDAGNISDGGEQVSVVREAPDFELDEELDEALLPQLLLWFSAPLSQLFHESGVNMRFVPRIRAELHALRKSDDEAAAWARTPAADRLSEVLLHETICRTIKTRFREWLRKARSPDQVDWLIYRLLALLCGNGAKTDGVDPMAVGFWRFLLVDDLVSKYGPRMAKHILNDTEALRVALAEYGAWLKHFADADAPASASVAGRFLFRLVCSLRLEMPARRFPGELIDGVHRLGRSALNYAEESVGPLTDLVSGALLFHGDDPRSYPVDVDVYPAVKHVAVRQFLPLDKAQQSLEEELAHREAALGSDVHPQLCTSLGALLELFRIWSEDEPAISFQRGSAVAERILGIWRAYRAEQQTPASDQQQRARVHAELFAQVLKVGSFYAHFDAYVQARNVFQEAVDSVKDDREASYEYAQAMRRLGQILSRLGSYHKYVELAQASLDILRRVRLGDHPDTAEALDDLGTALMLTGDFEQSTQLLNESLAMYQRVLSTSDHPDIARVLLHIGYNHWKIGQPKLMEAKLLQSVEVFQKVYGYAHPRVAEALTTLSVCVEGRHEYRMQQLAEALRIEKLVFGGEDSPRVARILRQMAIIHGEMGQHEIREELLLRALQAQRAAFAGRQHPELFRTLTQLALCYVDLEQPDRLLYILDNHLPPTSEIMEENSSISLLVRGLGTGNYGYVNELVEGAVRLLGEDNRHIKVLKTMQTRVAAKHTSRLASSVMIGSG